MVIRVGINGFGRIGRITFRTCFQNSEIQLTAINDPAIDIEYICYLIKFDSTHGKFRGNITHTDDEITINDHKIKVFQEKFPPDVPWYRAGVQYVIEASGLFTCLDKASGHLASEGVRRVLVTAPSIDIPMVILGVNDYLLSAEHKVISCTSSTLYCLAPIIKVLSDNFGVVEGFITSIHAMTPSLKPLDGLCLRGKHWRDHRSINQNIIPATTGACKALGKILPQVKDKMTGLAFRVPIVNVSVLDITIKLNTETSIEDIIKSVEKASRRELKNIIRISNEDAVSSDFIGDSHSCILDVDSSLQLTPNFFKIICWYENEYSYSCRVVDAIFYSEMQFVQSRTISSKTTYVRARLPCQTVVQKQNLNKTVTVHYNYITPPTDKIFYINSNESIKSKLALKPRPLLLRKPLSSQSSGTATTMYNREAKKKNEIFKIWNDDPPKSSVRQNKNSFFHSCITLGPKYPLQQTDCVKVQDRLENVKREFSKMLIITEDLLKKSHSSKNKLQYLGSKEVKRVSSNVELNVETLEDSQKNCKRSYTNIEVSNSIVKDCGDFKTKDLINFISDIENNETGACKHPVTDTMEVTKVEEKTNIYSGIRNTKVLEKIRLKESYENKFTIKENLHKYKADNTSTLNDKTNEHSERSKQLNIKENLRMKQNGSNSTDINLQVGKTIQSLTYAITNELVEDVFSDFNTSLTSQKSYQDNSIKIEENTPVKKTKGSQNSENNVSANKEKPHRHSRKDVRKYLPNNAYNMHIIDEELKKRNLILMSSNSSVNISNIGSELPAVFTEGNCKKIDFNKKVITGLRMVAEAGVGHTASKCGSSAHTVTTVSNFDRPCLKDELYDKLDSASASDSNNSFQINERKSQVLNITDLTNSLEDLARLDKICRIIEISDELSDKLFSNLDEAEASLVHEKKWSFKDLCEKIKLDEFCNNVFGKSSS